MNLLVFDGQTDISVFAPMRWQGTAVVVKSVRHRLRRMNGNDHLQADFGTGGNPIIEQRRQVGRGEHGDAFHVFRQHGGAGVAAFERLGIGDLGLREFIEIRAFDCRQIVPACGIALDRRHGGGVGKGEAAGAEEHF